MGATNNVQGHYGASTRVIKNIMKLDMGHLDVMFNEICKALCEDPHLDSLVFFCDYGKHRSVGAENLTSNAMRRVSSAWHINGVIHCIRKYWSRKKCGWKSCQECDEMNADKETAYRKAAQLFRQLWNERVIKQQERFLAWIARSPQRYCSRTYYSSTAQSMIPH